MSHITKNDPRTVFGWAMYDWANSAYITTFAAIVAAFFTAVIVPDGGFNGYSGQTLWSAVISIGAFALFLAMPVLGAKFSAIWGPLVFAVVSNATGSGRPAILSVVGFFVIGLILLSRVDVVEGRASRERWVFENA